MPVNCTQPVTVVEGVSKRIGSRLILEDVCLQMSAGQSYGISGPNGSGKSMLLRVICGLVRPTTGRVQVFGEEIGTEVEFPKETGALIETPGFLPNYSGFVNLQFLAMIRNQITKDEIAATIRLVGLNPEDRRPVRTYSTGMRQRLGIAQALMERPRLLILDEPSNGLDREGIRDIHRILKELKSQGVTILLTSHSREEIQTLCDASFLMDTGNLTCADFSSIWSGTKVTIVPIRAGICGAIAALVDEAANSKRGVAGLLGSGHQRGWERVVQPTYH